MPEKKYHDILLDGDTWDTRVFQNKHEAINDWLRSKDATGKSRRTLNAYSRTANRFFHDQFPDTAPHEVHVSHIEQWVQTLADRDCSPNTKRRYVESLSSFYDWAMKRPRFKDITGNPAAVVLEELDKVRRERPDTATWECGKQVIWSIADPRDKTIAIVMAKTGARVSEVTTMKEDDLLLDEGFIRLRNRKGNTTTVNPIDDETREWLQRMQLMSNDTSDYLFTSLHGGRIKRERIRRTVRQAAVEAGIMNDIDEKRWHHKFTPHYYRTIFTSEMRNAGMPDHFIRYLRGDSDREAMDLYTKIPREQVREEYLKHIKPLNI